MDQINPIAHSLKNWIESNLPTFLTNLPIDETHETKPWEMPVIEDYVLVVAVKDYADGGVGVFSIQPDDSARYRIKGLLSEAFD